MGERVKKAVEHMADGCRVVCMTGLSGLSTVMQNSTDSARLKGLKTGDVQPTRASTRRASVARLRLFKPFQPRGVGRILHDRRCGHLGP